MFLLDEGRLMEVSRDGEVRRALKASDFQKLVSPGTGLDEMFLALTKSGVERLDVTTDLSVTKVVEGEELQLQSWGDRFLVYGPNLEELVVISIKGQERVPLTGKFKALWLVGQSVLIQTDRGFWGMSSAGPAKLTPIKLAFSSASEISVAEGRGKVVLWSSSSKELVEFPTGVVHQAGQAPKIGVRVLEDGTIMAVSDRGVCLFRNQAKAVEFRSLREITPASYAEWSVLANGDTFTILEPTETGFRSVLEQAKGVAGDGLTAGKVRQILQPRRHEPLLFLETSLSEEMIDVDGDKVIDLTTGEPRHLTVTGHTIFSLDRQSQRWNLVASEPRAALVGPIEMIGDRVVYATQTEPIHVLGEKLPVNRRHPYPAVILHGRSTKDSKSVWSFEKPRGETPAKGRLPETSWPVLTGDLLLTSEDNALLAIDPSNGELLWSSPRLPLDDSSPLMLEWPDGLALVATENSSRQLITFNPKDGSITGSSALNDTFFWERWKHLIGVLVVCAALAYYIYVAGKRELYIRKIAGLQALDEAVGRATEMGKPVLYVVGLADVDDIQTLASLSILSHVAKKTAEYDTPIVTTTARAVTFSAAQEIVRDAFSIAGRPDAFSVESVRYISDDQFGYTAGVDGIMVREKPAANFYIGNFYAESLILAETGHATGSIQIAGTAQPNQLPFFVAACDYTLIGEELFAASAYLSRDPLQVGSLRGQDVGKMIVMILLVVCSLLVSFGLDWETLTTMMGIELP